MKYFIAIIMSSSLFGCRQKSNVFLIQNKNGMRAVFCAEGARLMSLFVPDKNGKATNVVIGFDSAAQYANSTEPYFGATIGRYGNRIARGKFSLNGQTVIESSIVCILKQHYMVVKMAFNP